MFQQPSDSDETRQSTSVETDVHVLDKECSTELHITRLEGHKPPSTMTYWIETKLLKQVNDILFSSQQNRQWQTEEEECCNCWMMVTMVIDRFLLCVFTLLTIIVSLVLLLNHPTYGYNHVSQPLDTLDWSWISHLRKVTQCSTINYSFNIIDDRKMPNSTLVAYLSQRLRKWYIV